MAMGSSTATGSTSEGLIVGLTIALLGLVLIFVAVGSAFERRSARRWNPHRHGDDSLTNWDVTNAADEETSKPPQPSDTERGLSHGSTRAEERMMGWFSEKFKAGKSARAGLKQSPPLSASALFDLRWVTGLGEMLDISPNSAEHTLTRAREHGLEPAELKTTGGGVRFVVFRGNDPEAAKRFLRATTVDEEALQYVVETPDGAWGADILGLYLENLRPWQLTSPSDAVVGTVTTTALLGAADVLLAASRGKTGNFVVDIQCGGCGTSWADGVQYLNTTAARCPVCGVVNTVDTTAFTADYVERLLSLDTSAVEPGDESPDSAPKQQDTIDGWTQPTETSVTPELLRPQEAMQIFQTLANSATTLSEAQVLREMRDLCQSWRGQAVEGELLEILATVASNIRREQSIAQCQGFHVTSGTDGSYVQVLSLAASGEPMSAHRVWRTHLTYHLLSAKSDALGPDRMYITLTSPIHRDRVDREYAQELSRKTRDSALAVLANRFGGDWAKSIQASICLEGPEITYTINGVVLSGRTFVQMRREVAGEFVKSWLNAIETTAG